MGRLILRKYGLLSGLLVFILNYSLAKTNSVKAIQPQTQPTKIHVIGYIALGVVIVVLATLFIAILIRKGKSIPSEPSNASLKTYKVEVDFRGNPVFVNKVWQDVIVMFIGFSSIPLLVWICSRLIPNFTGWELYVYGGLFIILAVMPFTVAHARKQHRRFVVSPEGLYINDLFFIWSDIEKLEITQATADYPEVILYLSNQHKEEHPLVLGKTTYYAFTDLLIHYLGDKARKVYRANKHYTGNSSAYHDPF
ncbi:hypothetical protein BKI52_19415 [marine bacterium AO1-C]|nr:hypothetical protein BKI52_19415 [marine bacterium AO1-C]